MTAQEFRALTVASQGGLLRVIASDCQVCAAFDPVTTPPAQQPQLRKFSAIWDTGASASVITQGVVSACGLHPISIKQVYHAHGVTQAEAFLVNIMLPNGVGFANMEVTKGDIFGADMLIGMDIINAGDLTIANVNQRTVLSFRIPSLGAVDCVKQTKEHMAAGPSNTEKRRPGKPRR